MHKQTKVIITKDELKGLPCQDTYIQNKLRHSGVPITGLFSFSDNLAQGVLSKQQITSDIIEYTWEIPCLANQ